MEFQKLRKQKCHIFIPIFYNKKKQTIAKFFTFLKNIPDTKITII